MPRLNIRLAILGLLAVFVARLLHGAEDDLADWVNDGQWPRGPNAVETTPEKQAAKAKRLEQIGDVKQAAEQYRRLGDVYSEAEQAEEGLILSARNYL